MTVGAVILPAQGTGTTQPDIAVDTVGGREYQLMKLVDGTVDSVTPAPITAPADASSASRAALWVNGQLLLYNGTTWDRARGSVANGLLADVSRIQTALPAGTNGIGKLTANSGVDIGDVTVNNVDSQPIPIGINDNSNVMVRPGDVANSALRVNVVAGAVSGGTEYAEGTIDSSIVGTAIMWEDTGDAVRPVSATKPLPVNVVAGATAGTEYTEGATDTTITGAVIMFESNTGTSTISAVNATTPLPVTQTGAIPAGTNNIGDVDVLTMPAVVISTLPATPAGTNNIGDVDVLTLPADPLGANADAIVAAGAAGSLSAKLRRATQGLEDLKSLIVLAAGANAIGKLAVNDGIDIGDVSINNAATAPVPILITDTSNIPLKVGDATNGAMRVNVVAQAPSNNGSGRVTLTNTTVTDVVAATASVRMLVTSICVTNASATVDTKVDILDGATVVVRGFAAKGGGGWSQSGSPIFIAATNTAVRAQCGTTGADVDIFVGGYRV